MSSRIRYQRGMLEPPRRQIPYRRPALTPLPSADRVLRVLGPCLPPDPRVAVEVMRAIHGVGAPAKLLIAAASDAVDVGVVCAAWPEVERALRGAAPGWAVEVGYSNLASSAPLRLVGTLGEWSRHDLAPLRDARGFDDSDALAALLEAVQPLGEGEQLLVTYLVRPASYPRLARAEQDLTRLAPVGGLIGVLGMLLGKGPRIDRFEPRLQRRLEERLAEPGFEVVVTVALVGSERTRLASRARSVTSVFASHLDCGFGGIPLGSWLWRAGPDRAGTGWPDSAPSLYLTAGELAALWHPASSRVLVPGVAHLKRPTMPLPTQVARAMGLLLGVHRERGRALPVHLPRDDLDAGHLANCGGTGVGKSTLDHQLVGQLASEPDRPGIGLIDPNNDEAISVAERSIPIGREEDVVFLELGDTEYPVGLPLFWAPPGVPREALVQTTFSILRLIFREHWSPTRMEDAVFALTATLCQLSNASLLDAPRLLDDAIFRRQATASLEDPVALEFWADYETLSEAGRRELSRPVLYRLRAFYRSPAVRNITCQTRGIDFMELLEHGRILLVGLAGSAIQAEADLLGELIIARLHLAALARLERPRQERKRFYLAVDESQRFRGASLPILLREGRKLGLTLILSTQYLDAWGEALSESVLGNVGTLVAFRCGPNDSRLLSTSLKPFTPEQLENLDRYEAVAKLQIGGATMPAFDLATLPIKAQPDEARLGRVRARTRQCYARPRREVEEEMSARNSGRSRVERGYDVDEE